MSKKGMCLPCDVSHVAHVPILAQRALVLQTAKLALMSISRSEMSAAATLQNANNQVNKIGACAESPTPLTALQQMTAAGTVPAGSASTARNISATMHEPHDRGDGTPASRASKSTPGHVSDGATPVAPTSNTWDGTADDRESEVGLKQATPAQIAQQALLGFAFTSLSDAGTVKLHFRSVNKRPLFPPKAEDLVKSFHDAGVRNWHNPIPILVPAGYVDLSTVTRAHIKWVNGPTLEWLPAAHGQTVECLDGRHRREALRLRLQELETRRNKENVPQSIEALKRRLDDIDTLGPDQMRWLVSLYDEGESPTNVFVFGRAEDAWLIIRTDIVGDNEAVKNLLSADPDLAWSRQLR